MRIIFCVLILYAFQCHAQKKEKYYPKHYNMKTFNINKFEKDKVSGECNFTLNDGSRVRQTKYIHREEYIEEIKAPIEPFTTIKVFFMNSGKLKSIGERFYNFPVGVWYYYNEDGKLMKEKNWDAPYKFTIGDLAKKMMSMKIDIMKYQAGIDVFRTDDPKPTYIVHFPAEKPYQIYNLVISGISGADIEQTTSNTKH